MPNYTEEELMDMDAIVSAYLTRLSQGKEWSFDEIKLFSQMVNSYKLQNPEKWEQEVRAANDEEAVPEYDVIKNLAARQKNLLDMLEAEQEKSVTEFNKSEKKSSLSHTFTVFNKQYEDEIQEEARHLILKGTFFQIRDEVCAAFEKEYKESINEAGAERDSALEELEKARTDYAAYKTIANDETYNNLLAEKAKLQKELEKIEKEESEQKKLAQNKKQKDDDEYELPQVAKLNKKIADLNYRINARANELVPGVYDEILSKIGAKQQEIENQFTKKSITIFNEFNKKINDEFKIAIEKRKNEEIEKMKGDIERFHKEIIAPQIEINKTEKEQEKEKQNLFKLNKISNALNEENENENEINTSSKKNDKPKEKEGKTFNVYSKQREILQHEMNLHGQILKNMDDKIFEADYVKIEAQFVNEPNDKNSPFMYTNISSYLAAYEIELECVKETFQYDKDKFRVAQKPHLDRISGINRILKNNKKTGLTKNTREYKEVLNQLDIFEKGLVDNGWNEVVMAEREGYELTPEQETKKREMLKQLDNVFNAASYYMVKKGPQKKSWGHGQARYDLMYLLCNEIYKEGGHAAEVMSRMNKMDKESDAHKENPSRYLHQIPNATNGSEALERTYGKKIAAAIKSNDKEKFIDEVSAESASSSRQHNKNNNLINQSLNM